MNPRYKFSDTENVRVTKLPVGVVSDNIWYLFDQPFIAPAKAELELDNGEWFLVRVSNGEEDRIKQEGMWKADRT